MNHPQPFAALPPAAGRSQILDAQEVITDAAGVAPRLFRAPGGNWSPAVLSILASLQMRPLAWNIDPRDLARPGTAAVTSSLSAAKPGDILLCHDGGGNRAETLAALGTVLPRLIDRGLRFVTL
jgi:peptidoglycan/xylan/chitin deacetylase (PgdA/CDA1 family)